MGIFVFFGHKETGAERELCYDNNTKGVILFLLHAFMVPSIKKTASIFLEILFVQYRTIFSCKQYDINTAQICRIERHQYL